MTAVIAEGAPAGTPLYMSTAGVADANGTIVSSPYLGNSASAAAAKFAAAYTAAYGSAPELHGAKAYDGAEVMIAALKACNDCTGLALANAIRAVHYDGLLGSFSYDTTGVGIFATSIGVITGGKIQASQLASHPARQDEVSAVLLPDADQRAELRGGLRPGRARLLAGLPDHGPGQLRPWRGAHDRRVRGVHVLPVGTAAVRGRRAGRHGGHRRGRAGHRASAAPTGEQGLRPDAHRDHRRRHGLAGRWPS